MNISLSYNKVLNLSLNASQEWEEENNFDFSFEAVYPEDDHQSFLIVFKLNIQRSNQFVLETLYSSAFKTDGIINQEFKESDFTSINAPAIAFPFLRSFIATITLNAGYNPIILPSINFLNFKNKK
jgi:preprotein translocase subunit SecB